MTRLARPLARALLGAVALLAAATLEACARGRLDESTTDVPISGRSPRVDPAPVLDGAVDEYGDPIKPTPDIPEARVDAGVTRDVGGVVDAGACGAAGRPCCAGSTCSNNLRCVGSVCAEASPCGAWQQPCCGVSACWSNKSPDVYAGAKAPRRWAQPGWINSSNWAAKCSAR